MDTTLLTSAASRVCLYGVAVVLLLAGVQKARDVERFRKGLLFIPYMRVGVSRVLGYAVPGLEIAAGLAVLAGRRPGLLVAIGLFTLFALVALLVLSRNLEVPCHCFGSGDGRVFSRGTVALNAALVGAAIAGRAAATATFDPFAFVVALNVVLLVPLLAVFRSNVAALSEAP